MASRSELRRRRQRRLLSVVLLVIIAFTFVRDVIHAAHDSVSARSSRNTTFGALANVVLHESNRLDRDTMYVLKHAGTTSRDDFVNQWSQLEVRARQLSLDAARLTEPPVDRGVNERLVSVMATRVTCWEQIRSLVAAPLELAPVQPATQSLQATQGAIASSNATWRAVRGRLRHEPGRVRLVASRWRLADPVVVNYINTALGQVRLHAAPTVAINTLSVDPQPLPSQTAQLVLLSRDQFNLGVSMRNRSSSDATVTVHLLLSPEGGSGDAVQRSQTIALARHSNAAVLFDAVPIRASEHGMFRVWVTGARPTSPGLASRILTFKVASAG